MKKWVSITFVAMVLSALFAFLLWNYVLIPDTQMQSIRLIIDGGPNNDMCRIDIYSDGIMEIATNEGEQFHLLGFDGDANKKINNPRGKTKRLSGIQRDEIDALIRKMKENGDASVSVDSFPSDIILIQGIIGETNYYASFEDCSGWVRTEVNFDLVRLAYALVDIAPKVEGTRIWDSAKHLKRWEL